MRAIFVSVVYLLLLFYACSLDSLDNNQPERHPERIFITFAEGETVGLHDEGIRTGYRMGTEPELQEMKTRTHVDSLEVYPSKIELKVGQVYSLKNLRVIAINADGQIVEHAPIFLAYCQHVLCLDDCNQGWEEAEPSVIEIVNRFEEADLIRGLRPGRIELRIQTLSHPDGRCPVVYVDLMVE